MAASATALISLQFDLVNANAFTGISTRLNDLQVEARRLEAAVNRATNPAERTTLEASLRRVNNEVGNLQGSLTRGAGLVGTLQQNLSRLRLDMDLQPTEAGIARVNAQIANTQRELTRLNGLGAAAAPQQPTAGAGLSLGGLVTRAAVISGVTAITGAMASYAKTAVEASSETQNFKTALTTMLQSKEKAEALNAEIVKLAATTPFELRDVQEYTKRLLAMGVAQKDIIPVMKSLGDISATVGKEKLPQIVLAFGQVKTAGRLMGSELRQFSEAGVPLLSLIAKNMNEVGKTTKYTEGSIKEMVTKGEIGFDKVRDAMISATQAGGQFGGLAAAAAKTVSGQMSNLNDVMYQTKVAIGDELSPAASKAIGLMSDLAKAFGEYVGTSSVEKLQKEQIEFNALASTIAGAAENTQLRTIAVAEMQAKYPLYFAMLNKEKDLTADLGRVLAAANAEYRRKIELAGAQQFADKQAQKAVDMVDKQLQSRNELNAAFGVTEAQALKINDANLQTFYINKLLDEQGFKSGKTRDLEFARHLEQMKTISKTSETTYGKVSKAFSDIVAPNAVYNRLVKIVQATKQSEKAYKDAANAQAIVAAKQDENTKTTISGLENEIKLKEAEIQVDLKASTGLKGDKLTANNAKVEQAKRDLEYLRKQLDDKLGKEIEIKPAINEKAAKKAKKEADELAKFLEDSLQSVEKLIRKEKETTEKLREKGQIESLKRLRDLNDTAEKAQLADYEEKQKDFVQKYKEKGLTASNPEVRKIMNEYGALRKVTEARFNQQLLNDTEAYLKKVREIVVKNASTQEIEKQALRIASLKTQGLDAEFAADYIAELELEIQRRKLKEAERLEMQGVELIAQQRADALGTSLAAENENETARIKQKYIDLQKLEQDQYEQAARERRAQKALKDIQIFDESEKRAAQNLENENNQEITYLNEKYNAGIISEEQYQKSLKAIQVRYNKEKIQAQLESLQSEIDIRNSALNNTDLSGPDKDKIKKEIDTLKDEQIKAQRELSQVGIGDKDNTTKKLKDLVSQYSDAYSQISNIVADFTKRASDAEISGLDRLIEKQNEAVANATENAGKGATEALKIEQNRLEELIKKREIAAAKQAQIDAALAAGQFALSIANGIVAITEQAKQPFPLNIIAIGATVAGLAIAGIAVGSQVAEAQKNAAALGFADGGYTGDGLRHEVAGIVHKGEFVMRQDVVKQNRPLLEALHTGKDIARPNTLTGIGIGSISGSTREMRNDMQNLRITVIQNEAEQVKYLREIVDIEKGKQKAITAKENKLRLNNYK